MESEETEKKQEFLPGREPAPAPDAHDEAAHEPAPAAEAASAPVPGDHPPPTVPSDAEVERRIRQMTRRSFLWGTAAALAGVAGLRWLATRRLDDGISWPLRRGLEINEQLARDYFQSSRLALTFPRTQAKMPRTNGDLGLDEDFDPADWLLRVEGLSGVDEPAELSLDEIKKLPRTEMVTELKCIEGWSEVVYWAGARFADFVAQYVPAAPERPERWARYVSLETPDGGYYVGLDIESALHPQTLLCYEMDGQALTLEHGAPLRLVIPVKYGIKSIKRIGTMRFTNRRPSDYWAERGYDWYAGH